MFHSTFFEDGKLLKAEEIISYQFTDRLGLRQALQLVDSIYQDRNKEPALLGDAVIKLVLIKEGLRRYVTRGKP